MDPTGDWQNYFKPLSDTDIQGPNGKSPEDGVAATSKGSKRLRGAGEGVRQLSWIWRVRRTANTEKTRMPTEADLDKCNLKSFQKSLKLTMINYSDLRIEYTKAKARVSRWHEEILLVVEEMRRTVAFLQWKARWWQSLTVEHHVRTDIHRGLIAYRHRQEAQLLGLAEQFAQLWRPTLQANHFDISWVDNFLSSR